jgi:hypothetical protein
MPSDSPPKDEPAQPRFLELPAGSFLWRVSGKTSGSPFMELPSDPDVYDPRRSGRFDPTPECQYSYCYAAFDDLTAICEVLLRDVGFDASLRYLPKREVAGRRLGIVETLQSLWLIRLLDAADLAAARQDSWLVHTDQANYRLTRRWAHWLRDSQAPDGGQPAGIVWPSKRQPSGRAVLLFGDRCADAVIWSSFGERRLDDDEGLAWLNRRLFLLRTKVRR